MPTPLEERFTKDGPVPEYAPHLGPCWLWTGAKNAGGYGVYAAGGKKTPAHRATYEHFVGPIPDGLHVDHLCRVTSCVNPSHLEPVTCRENVLRGISFAAVNARKTECHQGHPLIGDNLRIDTQGWRQCRECRNERQRRFKARNPGYTTKYAKPRRRVA